MDGCNEHGGAGLAPLERLDRAIALLQSVVREVEPERVTGEDANRLLEKFVRVERVAAAGRLGFAGRAAQCMTWRMEGHRSAQEWLAQKTKSSVGEAVSALQTAAALPPCPATREALCRGDLSVHQAKEISAAAKVDPRSEADLIEAAGYLSLKGLQYRARSIKAAAVADQQERIAAIHRGRFLRHWTDGDGAFHLHARLTPDTGVTVLSHLKARAGFAYDEAREARVAPETDERYLADALVALVTGDRRRDTFQGQLGGRQRSATVLFHVSAEALRRGRLEPGELCEVAGVGPVPLAVIEDVLGDSFAKVVIRDGVDVTTVCHVGRAVPAHVETALEARDRTCVVPGCDVQLSLEIDHWQVPFSKGGPTELWNLARICHFHHQLKTYEGYELRGGPGKWEWAVAPGAPGQREPAIDEVALAGSASRAGPAGGWP